MEEPNAKKQRTEQQLELQFDYNAEEGVNSDNFKIKLMRSIKEALMKKYEDKLICPIMFNESLYYKGIKYNDYYELYPLFNPSIKTFSQREISKIYRLSGNVKIIKKGNRCNTCLYPIGYIRNSKLHNFQLIPCIKKCEICPKIQIMETYTLTVEVKTKLEKIKEKIKTVDLEDKIPKTKRVIVNELLELFQMI